MALPPKVYVNDVLSGIADNIRFLTGTSDPLSLQMMENELYKLKDSGIDSQLYEVENFFNVPDKLIITNGYFYDPNDNTWPKYSLKCVYEKTTISKQGVITYKSGENYDVQHPDWATEAYDDNLSFSSTNSLGGNRIELRPLTYSDNTSGYCIYINAKNPTNDSDYRKLILPLVFKSTGEPAIIADATGVNESLLSQTWDVFQFKNVEAIQANYPLRAADVQFTWEGGNNFTRYFTGYPMELDKDSATPINWKRATDVARKYILPYWTYDLAQGEYTNTKGSIIATSLWPQEKQGTSKNPITFYRCESYDNGEAIPAYTNIQLSGLTSPVEANGIYSLQDIEATGIDRVWINEAGYKIESVSGSWYIYDGGITPNNMTALFYAPIIPATSSDGSNENPVYWDDALASADDRTLSESYLTSEYSSSGNKRNFYVKLVAGTPYQIGIKDGHGIDANIILYNLSGSELGEGDETQAEINGISCTDSVSYTPSTTGIYRISAGAFSTASGTVQVVCYPAPEFVEAPTVTEPWEIEWTVGGAAEGAKLVTEAGRTAAMGEYTPSNDALDNTTVWTNTKTGTVFKAYMNGSNWRWHLYPSATNTSSWSYYEDNYRQNATPWDVVSPHYWSGSTQPYPVLVISNGYNATGTLTLTKSDIAARPATGVKVWSGYKATQDNSTLEWTFADKITSNLQVNGYVPIKGRIYSADTTIQVASMTEESPGQMICLAHFDSAKSDGSAVFIDGTDTCIISTMPQASVTYDRAKFGKGSWGGNYRAVAWNGGFNIIGLPAVSGDFTVEFWHYYSGYTDFGGLILYVYENDDYDQQEVASLNAIKLSKNSPMYIEDEWFHHAFVRKNGIVTEYINGVKVAEHEFSATLGGSYGLAVYGGGWSQSDVRNNIDEFVIFNYAKYDGKFTPPYMPYEDKQSGLHTPDTGVREIAVSRIKGITWANSQSYALVNASSTGTSRQWVTADGQWYIHYDDMSGYWAIANGIYPDESGYIQAAYISSGEEQYYIEPIGNANWIDAITGTKVNVISLS